jgi:IclR family pca regulon transcriptional regulator
VASDSPAEAVERRRSLQSLERGIAVLQAFSHERPAMTLSDVARVTGITRATARRILLTLEQLGFVRASGRLFSLTPHVLDLGWAYLSSLNLWDAALPLMEELSERTHESTAAAALDLPDIVTVAQVPTRRVLAAELGLGARLPVHCTSAGHVLLADLPDDELNAFLATARLERLTDRTITDTDRLRKAIETVRANDWALVDQEMEIGLRTIAAPIRGASGRAMASLVVSTAASRVTLKDLRSSFVPQLRETAKRISAALDRTAGAPSS